MKFCGEVERGQTTDEWIRFWWRSKLFRGFWIIFQDSLPLADTV